MEKLLEKKQQKQQETYDALLEELREVSLERHSRSIVIDHLQTVINKLRTADAFIRAYDNVGGMITVEETQFFVLNKEETL